MIYAQFYHYGAITKDTLFEACGDRAVIIYDGRVRNSNLLADAVQECSKRKFDAVALFRGETFTRSVRITEIVKP